MKRHMIKVILDFVGQTFLILVCFLSLQFEFSLNNNFQSCQL